MARISTIMITYLKHLFLPLEGNNYRPGILEKRYFLCIVLFLIGVKILSIVSFERLMGADIFNSISQVDLYTLTNQTRKQNQLPVLTQDPKLELAAQMKLNDMLQNNYFAHVSPSGTTPWVWIEKSDYDYLIAGENLAMNFYNSDQTMKAWLNSEAHRKNILLPEFKDIGIAVGSGLINNQNTTIVVQVFGKSKTAMPIQIVQKPIVTNTPKPKPQVVAKATVRPTVNPTAVPSTSFVPTTSATPTVKPTPSVIQVAQVKSEITFAKDNQGWSMYSYNLFLERLMVILVAITLVILVLKIMVNINIQVPELIFRGVVLIILSVAFAKIQDPKILSYIYGNVILP